jgi:hypothetical protein
LKGPSLPLGLRVPSGAIHTRMPRSSSWRLSAKLSMARSRFRRSISMKPAERMAAPNTGTW